MVKLYREKISEQADRIEAELNDMLFAYERVYTTPEQAATLFGEGHQLPIVNNNEKTVSGEDIDPYLVELRKLMRDWQRFQGDFCYVDDDGEPC